MPSKVLPARLAVVALVAIIATSAIVATTGPAAAVALTNRDTREHKVTVLEGDARQDHTLAPLGVLNGVCLKGCLIRLNDSDNDEYELEGNEIVSIEDGYLYYDGPETPAAPGPGDAPPAAPAQPK